MTAFPGSLAYPEATQRQAWRESSASGGQGRESDSKGGRGLEVSAQLSHIPTEPEGTDCPAARKGHRQSSAVRNGS